MKVKVKIEKEVDLKTLSVKAGARYWEDAMVNGQEDVNGTLIPCRIGDYWCPEIDIETGKILNWKQGVIADIHYKVCDDGEYHLKDSFGNIIITENGYVPSTMCPKGNGYGDYIKMNIDHNGIISNWKFNIEDFVND